MITNNSIEAINRRVAALETKLQFNEQRLESIEMKMDRATWLLVSILIVTLVGMILRAAGIQVPIH